MADVKSIIDAIPCPTVLARPVRDGGGVLVDLHVEMLNDAFVAVPEINDDDEIEAIKSRKSLKSIFSAYIVGSVPILHLASLALAANRSEATFYMPSTKRWYMATLEATAEGVKQPRAATLSADRLIVLTLQDITSDKQHVQELRKIAHRDRLTRLPTRVSAADALEVAKDTASFNNDKFGILLVDLDDIKDINDMNGQAAGDDAIRAAADVMRAFRDDRMTLFNYGSDEFLLIIPHQKSEEGIFDVARKVFESFKNEGVRASGGIAIYPDHTDNTDRLVQFADMAMGVAKQTGKNRFVSFENTMHESFVSRLTMQKRLTEAVLMCSFKQYYQPQFDVKTGELRGFEALIRWQDDNGKFVPPDVFIPIAEETHLIIPIGKWVLNTACSTLKKWQDKYNFKGIMSVNVSPVQMMQENFLSELIATVEKHKLDPASIEVEVTEGVMIDNMRLAVQTLNSIKKMGMRVSLDDFGTGYSSLNYLQKLPLDTLKIDKSFINNITDKNGVQAKITNSIIGMVSSMGLDTIAEGVEDIEQLALLRKFNCNTVQGYLEGKPMPLDKCDEYLAGNIDALDRLADNGAIAQYA